MTDVYKRLAKRLDELPGGYPETESGVERRILEKIFTPEEAEMTLRMRSVPETVEQVAERLGRPVPEMQEILDNLHEKGQIGSFKMFGQRMYMLFPYIVGIYEFQLNRMDKEMAELFEAYAPYMINEFGSLEPAVGRVIPVSTEIDADQQVHRYEDVQRMIEEARSFQLMECICRKEKALLGQTCSHKLETCLGISGEEDAFDKFPRGRVISKEEAKEVIREAEEAGLVHWSYNVQEGHAFVCNCCSCCCGALRGLREFNAPQMVAKSHYLAVVNEESCTACGVCADERCPVDAIALDDGYARVVDERCIGCGACTTSCPTESIRLERKPDSEQDTPPVNLMQWYKDRATSRGIELKLG
jgi:Na+-translocating ferredoxin:NAD+ oxidoreductase RNF subunit RnfB